LQDSWPNHGEILVDGKPVRRLPTRWDICCKKTIFLNGDYLPERDFGAGNKENTDQETKEYALKLLATYGLYEFKDKYPSQLSGE